MHNQRGIWSNRAEIMNWRGDVDISEYQLHRDSNPLIMTKKAKQEIEYVQELAIRYLRPPTPPAPGEVVITQEPNIKTGPAPPLIIRQAAARAETPEPLVVREAPPEPPKPVGPKRITISGKRIPPPPRKVIIERLAPLPAKPQNVIIERWLPYAESKRRVIFNKAKEVNAEVIKPRNVIIQWEAPKVNVKKEIKYLGVLKANPNEYVERYGSALKNYKNLPDFVTEIPTPSDVGTLAAEHQAKQLIELEGELEAFQYVDLDSAGLSEYRSYLQARGIQDLGATRMNASTSTSFSAKQRPSVNASTSTSFTAKQRPSVNVSTSTSFTVQPARVSPVSVNASTSTSAKFHTGGSASVAATSDLASVLSSLSASGSGSAATSQKVEIVANAIFDMIDIDNSGYIDSTEADKIILRLNSRLRRSYGATEATAFFQEVSEGSDRITRAQFISAIQRLA